MYKLIKDPLTGRLSEYVKNLEDNIFCHSEHNEEYKKWLAEGNTPEPADE